jgi:hypothetical protein
MAPGLFYGFALAAYCEKPTTALQEILFLLLSIIINVYCVYQIDFLNDKNKYPYVRLLTNGGVGAILLSLCYDLILVKRFSALYTVILPFLYGVMASVISAACMYLLHSNRYHEPVSGILWIGMYTIFPMWQYFFGLNIKNHNKHTITV